MPSKSIDLPPVFGSVYGACAFPGAGTRWNVGRTRRNSASSCACWSASSRRSSVSSTTYPASIPALDWVEIALVCAVWTFSELRLRVVTVAFVCAIGGEQYEGIRDDLPKIDRLQKKTNVRMTISISPHLWTVFLSTSVHLCQHFVSTVSAACVPAGDSVVCAQV